MVAQGRQVNRNAFQKPSLPNQRGEKHRSQSREAPKRDVNPTQKVKLSDDDELSMIEKNPDIQDPSLQSAYLSKPPLGQPQLLRKYPESRPMRPSYHPSSSSYQRFSTRPESVQPQPIE